MLINMRNGLMAGGGWKNPYVTDGLVAMWDGEWNAGPGVHDADATAWKDLVGGVGDASFNRTGAEFGDLSVNFNYTQSRLQTPVYSIGDMVLTMELTARRTGGASNGELGALWVSPWFGINLRSSSGVRFTFGADVDYTQNTTKGQTYALVRQGGNNRFYAGATILGSSSRSISFMATKKLGMGAWQDNTAPQLNVSGDIYALRLYSRALTADEIAANYAVDKARFNLPDAT